MKNLLYIVVVIFMGGWVIGFFVYDAGRIIHILPVIALSALIIKLIQEKRTS